MIYVTHSADEVHLLADHMLVLDGGRVVAQGSPDELLTPAVETRYQWKP
jgi:ABC-type molybdate transport system ATPase subunit